MNIGKCGGSQVMGIYLKENRMRKCFFILLILWFVCGCKSKQKFGAAFREEENRVEQVEAVGSERMIRDSAGRRVQEVVGRKVDGLETETVVRVKEYDTSKPVVAGTGRAPVSRETEIVTKQRKAVQEEVAERISESGEVARVEEKQSVVSGRNEVQQEVTGKVEQEKVRKSGYALWNWMGLAGVMAILGYVYWRKWR